MSKDGAATGELVVGRSFSLAGLPVALMIDGRRATTIPFNRRYHVALAVGWHTLGVRQIPMTHRSRSADVRLFVEKGKSYELTASKVGPEVVLQQKRN